MTLFTALCGVTILVALLVVSYLAGAKNPFRCAAMSGGLGIGALLLVEVTGHFTGVTLPLSLLNLAVCLAGGPSGASLLLAINQWIV